MKLLFTIVKLARDLIYLAAGLYFQSSKQTENEITKLCVLLSTKQPYQLHLVPQKLASLEETLLCPKLELSEAEQRILLSES